MGRHDNMLSEPGRITKIWQAGEGGLVGVDAGAILLEDKQFELSGTSAVDADCTWDADHGLLLTTPGGATDREQNVLLPSTDADNSSTFREISWGTDRESEFECVIRTGTLISLEEMQFGLVLTVPTPFDEATDADQVKFGYLEGTDTTWQCQVSIGNVDTAVNSNVTVVANSVYHFAIRIDKDRLARFYINDRLVHVTTALTDAVDLLPTVGVQAGTATLAAAIHVRGIAMARVLAS